MTQDNADFQELESFPEQGYLVMIHKWNKEKKLECIISTTIPNQWNAGDKIALIDIDDFEKTYEQTYDGGNIRICIYFIKLLLRHDFYHSSYNLLGMIVWIQVS